MEDKSGRESKKRLWDTGRYLVGCLLLLCMAGEENAYQLFETAGQAMLMSMGGASGVIFGSLYLAGAKGMDPKSVITSKDLADMEKKSLEAIQERGGAQVGDKTMVDALSPAVDALAANADKGLLEMLKAAEESAKQGVDRTSMEWDVVLFSGIFRCHLYGNAVTLF